MGTWHLKMLVNDAFNHKSVNIFLQHVLKYMVVGGADVGFNKRKQVHCDHRPFNRRNNCLTLCSLAPILPAICLFHPFGALHYLRFPITWERSAFPSNSPRKMGWQFLPCGVQVRHHAKTSLRSFRVVHSPTAFLAAILANVYDFFSKQLWTASSTSTW